MTSSGQQMTCEACRDALTELVCQELDEAAASQVRAHVKTCPECAAQLARFERVMGTAASELETPSPRVREHVMLQAREALTRRAAQKATSATPVPSASGLRAWLERLGHWAMSPQVAMATVLLLVVGLGIYALPFGRKEPRAALTPALDVHPTEGAESAAATTSPVVEMKPQEASDELARDEAQPRAEPSASAAKSAGRFAPKPEPRASRSRSGGGADNKALDDALGGLGSTESAKKKAAAPSKLEAQAQAPLYEREQVQFAPPPAPVAPKSDGVEGKGASSYGAPADRARSAAPSGAQAGVEAQAMEESVASSADGSVDEGIRRAQAGDAVGAIRILRPLVSSGSDSERQRARLWLARSYRASGDCKSALAYYEGLTARKDVAATVLSEAADCYARLGNDAEASALRSRAKGELSKPKSATPAQ